MSLQRRAEIRSHHARIRVLSVRIASLQHELATRQAALETLEREGELDPNVWTRFVRILTSRAEGNSLTHIARQEGIGSARVGAIIDRAFSELERRRASPWELTAGEAELYARLEPRMAIRYARRQQWWDDQMARKV